MQTDKDIRATNSIFEQLIITLQQLIDQLVSQAYNVAHLIDCRRFLSNKNSSWAKEL